MNWNISQLDVAPTQNDFENVVITAHWEYRHEEDGFTARTYGASSFPSPEGDFTPYNELTKEQVLGWIWTSGNVNKEATEQTVQEKIDIQKNPPIIYPPLPWLES
jgi:hypothetical protein